MRFLQVILYLLVIMLFFSTIQINANSPTNITIIDSITIDHPLYPRFTDKQPVVQSPRGVVVGYFHPDGKLRMMEGSNQGYGGNSVVYVREIGNFGFKIEGQYYYSFDFSMSTFTPLIAYDFDQDGVDEVFGTLDFSPVFIGWNGTGYYPKWETIAAKISGSYIGVAVADVTEDGYPDLIDLPNIYEWKDDIQSLTLVATLEGGSSFGTPTIGDVDNDAHTEIVTYAANSPEIRIYKYDKILKTFFVDQFITASPLGYSSMAIADLDGDGKNEVIAGAPNVVSDSYPISFFRFDKDNFDYKILWDFTAAHFYARTGDIDADGFDEVLISQNGQKLLIIEADAMGNIIKYTYNVLGDNVYLHMYDFDEDTFPEITCASGSPTYAIIIQDYDPNTSTSETSTSETSTSETSTSETSTSETSTATSETNATIPTLSLPVPFTTFGISSAIIILALFYKKKYLK